MINYLSHNTYINLNNSNFYAFHKKHKNLLLNVVFCIYFAYSEPRHVQVIFKIHRIKLLPIYLEIYCNLIIKSLKVMNLIQEIQGL